MQKYVETLSAKLILEDKVKPKDTIVIDEKDGELTAYCESFAWAKKREENHLIIF